MNYFQLHPDVNICSQLYAYGLYWGYLFWKDGGMETIKSVLREILDERENPNDCEIGLTRSISDALATRPGLHDSHAAAAADFGLHAYRRDFVWGDNDGSNQKQWGDYLVDVLKLVQAAGSVPRSVDAWGMQYVKIIQTGTYDVTCSSADSSWTFRLLLKNTDGTVSSLNISCGTPQQVQSGNYQEVVFYALRAASTTGSYTLTVTAV